MRRSFALCAAAAACMIAGCSAARDDAGGDARSTSVRIEQVGSKWQLVRNGEPYVIRGAGTTDHLEELAAWGGNSIRTWDGEGIDELLDRAHELGLTVTVGMWLQHERHGFDYDAPGNKEAQLAKVERIVRAYKDHPAVLMWGVGNEVEIGGDLDIALRTIEDAAAVIKSIDRDHPTMAVIAEIGSDKLIRVQNECPSIDVIGINAYGGLASIPERMTAQGYSGPYVITEFGPSGHWESPTTEWGAPIEPTSTEKARAYDRKYASGIEADLNHRCVGSYVFLWGEKQETTATWFGMFLRSGEKLESVDVITRHWTGREPDNASPRIRSIDAEFGSSIAPGAEIVVTTDATDPDGDPLTFEYIIKAETTDRRMGGDRERRPPQLPDLTQEVDGATGRIIAPATPGPYRVFVFVRDGRGAAATGNIPFFVRE